MDPEPKFILKGHDPLADEAIAAYAAACRRHGLHAQAKQVGLALAEFAAWAERNPTRMRLPDHTHRDAEPNLDDLLRVVAERLRRDGHRLPAQTLDTYVGVLGDILREPHAHGRSLLEALEGLRDVATAAWELLMRAYPTDPDVAGHNPYRPQLPD